MLCRLQPTVTVPLQAFKENPCLSQASTDFDSNVAVTRKMQVCWDDQSHISRTSTTEKICEFITRVRLPARQVSHARAQLHASQAEVAPLTDVVLSNAQRANHVAPKSPHGARNRFQGRDNVKAAKPFRQSSKLGQRSEVDNTGFSGHWIALFVTCRSGVRFRC